MKETLSLKIGEKFYLPTKNSEVVIATVTYIQKRSDYCILSYKTKYGNKTINSNKEIGIYVTKCFL